jgi:dolichol-phosphate mannosyltransferase
MVVDLSIVLATYNESDNLPFLLREIDSKVDTSKQIIFVDDGSTDNTRNVILEYVTKEQSSKYVFNNGKQTLLRADCQGISVADGEFVIIMDSDLQHPPDLIPQIVERLKDRYDIVIASRYTNGGSTGNRDAVRGLISRIASFLARTILYSSRKTTDPLSGYFGFKKDLFKQINPNWRGYKLLLFILAENPSARICEVSYKFHERENGSSKIVGGAQFLRIYLTELILAKRIELTYRKKILNQNAKEIPP